MHEIPALFAASTPKGAFSTTSASVVLRFSFSTAENCEDGSGFPFVTSSAVITTSNCSFPNPRAWPKILSTSFFAEPLTTALRHLKFVTNSFMPSKGLKLNIFLKYSSFLVVICVKIDSSNGPIRLISKMFLTNSIPRIPSSK